MNTLFNLRGEPIVCVLEEVFYFFANMDMDYLVLGNYVVSKKDNPLLYTMRNTKEYLKAFSND